VAELRLGYHSSDPTQPRDTRILGWEDGYFRKIFGRYEMRTGRGISCFVASYVNNRIRSHGMFSVALVLSIRFRHRTCNLSYSILNPVP